VGEEYRPCCEARRSCAAEDSPPGKEGPEVKLSILAILAMALLAASFFFSFYNWQVAEVLGVWAIAVAVLSLRDSDS